ncbi:MucB/RseB C-terminal domain-containing protein [Colwellia sp. MB02u-10]|uniref:MucB/RseB C-terminal domain-containing protein n=1 Tax=Colwellia sp. MB02u-10 TaxID=2759828 RepID=UPI0015F5164A|nr:MucB/RseB C-terminal domain-containing protein [Colwellia sp. MB02u-10]MBA6341068.1 MucB/RseB C-terminal domain-containing protein [Colwellia sp. MB02u-10]
MKLISSLLLLVTISTSVAANENISPPAAANEEDISTPIAANESEQAEPWLERLATSLQTLNFSTSFVVVKNNQAEPYHWFHGVDESGNELEILSLLNGPRRDVLRKDNIVSYIEPELPPYSVTSHQITGPIPAVLREGVTALGQTYDFISVGRSRVLGRPAQLIRIVSKDVYRYGHWLWLDQESGMLLKLALANRTGQLLEQIQFTHLDITNALSESLLQLQQTSLPKVIEIPAGYQEQVLQWQVKWLPEGFKRLNANRHRISTTKKPVEFMLFNDGLVDVSVYVNPSEDTQRATDYVMDGATVVLNQVVNGFEVSVVGKIPAKTAKAIADSVVLNNQSTP